MINWYWSGTQLPVLMDFGSQLLGPSPVQSAISGLRIYAGSLVVKNIYICVISLETIEIQWAIERNVTFERQVRTNLNYQHRIMHKEHTQHNQRNPHNPHNQLERSKMDAIFQPQALRLWEVHQTSLEKNSKQVPTLFDIRIICLRVILHHVSGRVASVVSHGLANLQGITDLWIPTDAKCVWYIYVCVCIVIYLYILYI